MRGVEKSRKGDPKYIESSEELYPFNSDSFSAKLPFMGKL
jgi:hypothetical protein